jgi:uncharacterized caspase-like protein
MPLSARASAGLQVAVAPGNVAQSVIAEPTSPVNAKALLADKWALIVGISKFRDEKINLKFAAKDAADFASFLIKEENFAPDHVLLLTDDKATRKNILESLGSKWLPRLALPDDLVVLYFSTHGSPSDADVGGVNYLIAHDTEVENLYATGIPMQDLARMIKGRVHAGRIVVFLDACHSGATAPEGKGIVRVGNVDVEEMVQGTGQLVISSSAPAERSWESKNAENGVFTRHLIASLRKEGAATRLGTAFQSLKDDVQAEVLRDRGQLQTPVMKSRWEGAELALAAPATRPRPSLPYEPALDGLTPAKAGGIAEIGQAGKESLGSVKPAPETEATRTSLDTTRIAVLPFGTSSSSVKPGGEAESNVPNLKAGVALEHPEFARGIDGEWESNWGKVTFKHDAIVDDKPVKITGYWMQQLEKHRGAINSGTFDPKTGVLKFSYWQSWNFMSGSAHFKMLPGAKRLEGGWRHYGVAGDNWTMWRD